MLLDVLKVRLLRIVDRHLHGVGKFIVEYVIHPAKELFPLFLGDPLFLFDLLELFFVFGRNLYIRLVISFQFLSLARGFDTGIIDPFNRLDMIATSINFELVFPFHIASTTGGAGMLCC